TAGELQRIFDHVRTFCGDPAWPRGELNLPRAFATEKAYPEDEAVIAMAFEDGAVDTDLIYERRFGARNQIEFKLPIPSARFDDGWGSGFGDLAVGVKRAIYHSFARGSILSVAGEIILPTGNAERGRGKGTAVFEPFVSFGQILPQDVFLQFQGGIELPFDEARAEREGFWRFAVGRTFAADRGYGRSWTPMLELVAARELESGAIALWDAIPQLQVSLNQRQHILLSAGMRLPVNERAGRSKQFLFYVLWDWFDGGLFDGW
ncbi:MAG TPA: transporter, partial [Vicinamibacterales bacterium]|nr:transporter [Vicinamibacterales bacterium]